MRVSCHRLIPRCASVGAGHQSTLASCQQGEELTTIAVRPRRVRRGRNRQRSVIHFPSLSAWPPWTGDPPSSQYVNKCAWHATMQRAERSRDPVRGTSGPAGGTVARRCAETPAAASLHTKMHVYYSMCTKGHLLWTARLKRNTSINQRRERTGSRDPPPTAKQ